MRKRTAVLTREDTQEILRCLEHGFALESRTAIDFLSHLSELYDALCQTDDPRHPREIRVLMSLENTDNEV